MGRMLQPVCRCARKRSIFVSARLGYSTDGLVGRGKLRIRHCHLEVEEVGRVWFCSLSCYCVPDQHGGLWGVCASSGRHASNVGFPREGYSDCNLTIRVRWLGDSACSSAPGMEPDGVNRSKTRGWPRSPVRDPQGCDSQFSSTRALWRLRSLHAPGILFGRSKEALSC